jgi:midasin
VAVAGASSNAQEVLGSLWAKVKLAAPSEAEQLQVLSGLYPDLTPLLPLAQAAVQLVALAGRHAAAAAVAAGATASHQQHAAAAALAAAGLRPGELSLALGRHVSMRDLIKWCGRMSACHAGLLARCLKPVWASQQQAQAAAAGAGSGKGGSKSGKKSRRVQAAAAVAGGDASQQQPLVLDLSRLDAELKLAAFQECADLVAGVVAKHEAKLKLLTALAALWGCAAPGDVAAQYEELHKPNMQLTSHDAQVGRAVLPLQQHQQQQQQPQAAAGLGCFSPTGLALRLMERIGVCLQRGEPVLLVGETGTGKTTTLTQLAHVTGAQLVALNMSQQTDSSDLLGGYKPVGVGEALLPLLEAFGELLRRTWKK